MVTNRRWVLSCLIPLLALSIADASEFTADLVISEGNVVKTGRILVRDGLYRMEIEDPRGPAVVVQMLAREDLCRVLVPRYSLYMEMGRSEGIIEMFDPFLAAEKMKEYFTCVEEGTEDLAGHPCTKEAFTSHGNVVLYRWTAKELGFPLKILMVAQDGYFTELRNVKVEAVPEDLFTLPGGYQKTDWSAIGERVGQDQKMQAKEKAWAAKQPSSISLDAMLREGGEFRALVGDDLSIEITGREMGSADFVWSIVGMKGDTALPAKEIAGPGELAFAAESGVNCVVLRCLKDEMRGKISLSGLGKLVLATKTLERRDSGGGPGSSLPEDITAFRLRVKSLEIPGESTRPVRIRLTLEKPRDGSGEDESISHRLEPGQETTFERSGPGVIGGYDLTLLGPGGRAEVELTIDFRPQDEQKPF